MGWQNTYKPNSSSRRSRWQYATANPPQGSFITPTSGQAREVPFCPRHGSQYTSLVFGQRLGQAHVLGSMGTVGDALDNAVAESFFASLQVELLDRQHWQTRQQLTTAIFDYIEVFFNRQRLHRALGYLSPSEYEEAYALQQAA